MPASLKVPWDIILSRVSEGQPYEKVSKDFGVKECTIRQAAHRQRMTQKDRHQLGLSLSQSLARSVSNHADDLASFGFKLLRRLAHQAEKSVQHLENMPLPSRPDSWATLELGAQRLTDRIRDCCGLHSLSSQPLILIGRVAQITVENKSLQLTQPNPSDGP